MLQPSFLTKWSATHLLLFVLGAGLYGRYLLCWGHAVPRSRYSSPDSGLAATTPGSCCYLASSDEGTSYCPPDALGVLSTSEAFGFITASAGDATIPTTRVQRLNSGRLKLRLTPLLCHKRFKRGSPSNGIAFHFCSIVSQILTRNHAGGTCFDPPRQATAFVGQRRSASDSLSPS
jgi:hypothetical protein